MQKTLPIWMFSSVLLILSCSAPQKIAYFENVSDGVIQTKIENLEPVIQKNDLLSINISSLNPEATRVFNQPNTTVVQSRSDNGITQASGYLVDPDGYIDFPILGKLKASGSTKAELKNYIKRSLVEKKLLVDPIVDVRYLNYRVTVLGEVSRPSVITVPNEKISVLEALGLAGDLTIFARRDNVLLISEQEGSKTVKRIDLTKPQLLSSPEYYLKSNDVIYVEPNQAKVSSTSNTRVWLPVVFSGLSIIVVAIDRLTR